MAKISFDDLRINRDMFFNSVTLENLYKAIDDIGKESDLSYLDFIDFNDALGKLTKDDIKYLETKYKKKFDMKYIEKGKLKYEKEILKKNKKEQKNNGNSRTSNSNGVDFFDNPFDDFLATNTGSMKQNDFNSDVFDESNLHVNYVVSYYDFIDFLEKYCDEKQIFRDLLNVLKIDSVTTYASKKILLSLKGLLDKLTYEDIQIIENRLSKNFYKNVIIDDFRKMLENLKKQNKQSRPLFSFLKRKEKGGKKNSNSSISENPFDYDDDISLSVDQEDGLLFDEAKILSSVTPSSSNGPARLYSVKGDETTKDMTGSSHAYFVDSDTFLKEDNLSESAKFLVSDSYLSIINIIESISGQNIIEQFKDVLGKMRFNSDLSLEQYVIKSNLLIDEILLSLVFNVDEVAKKIQEHFGLKFSPDKTSIEVIKELIGDELRYYQQNLLPKKHNLNDKLGNSKIIKKNTKPVYDDKFSIIYITKYEKNESSYKFGTELLEQNSFSIYSSNDIPLSNDYIRYNLMNKLFDAGEYDLDVISDYDGKFQIVKGDWFLEKTK